MYRGNNGTPRSGNRPPVGQANPYATPGAGRSAAHPAPNPYGQAPARQSPLPPSAPPGANAVGNGYVHTPPRQQYSPLIPPVGQTSGNGGGGGSIPRGTTASPRAPGAPMASMAPASAPAPSQSMAHQGAAAAAAVHGTHGGAHHPYATRMSGGGNTAASSTASFATPTAPSPAPQAPLDPQQLMASDPVHGRKYIADKLVHDVYSKLTMVAGKRVVETYYLTHTLIKEYSHYPSTPPPPGTAAGSVKSRVLVICARHASGRIMIQKGKFNEQKNLYQIGRTWDMEELRGIKRIAPDEVILTLNKDYYWKVAEGPDRTTRFIKALASYYGSYTGKYPILGGITEAELRLPRTPVTIPIGNDINNDSRKPSVASSIAPNPAVMTGQAHQQAPPPRSQVAFASQPSGSGAPDLNDIPDDDDEFAPPGGSKHINATSMGSPRQPPTNRSHPYGQTSVHQTSVSQQPIPASPPSQDTTAADDESMFNFTPTVPKESSMHSIHDYIRDDHPQNRPGNRSSYFSQRSARSTASSEGASAHPRSPIKTRFDELRNSHRSMEAVEAFGAQLPPRSPLQQQDGNITDDEEEDDTEGSVRRRTSRHSDRGHRRQQSDQRVRALDQLEGQAQPPAPTSPFVPPPHVRPGPVNTDALDTSIQEIENLLGSQFAFDGAESGLSPTDDKGSMTTPKLRQLEEEDGAAGHSTANTTPGPVTPRTHPADIFDAGTPSLQVKKGPRDPEIDELFDEIKWGITDTSEDLLRKLQGELHDVKSKNVRELLNFDAFSDSSVAKEVTTATEEVDHLSTIFKRMELDFKLLLPQINDVDHQSKGLQLKFANQQTLYTTLKDILEKVNVNQQDLAEIANFTHFDQWKQTLPNLERKLENLYLAVQTVKQDNNPEAQGEGTMLALKEYESQYDEVIERFATNFARFVQHKMESLFRASAPSSMAGLMGHNVAQPGMSGVIEVAMVNQLAVDLLVYSALTYFCKQLSPSTVYALNQYFNEHMGRSLERNFIRKLTQVEAKQAQAGTGGVGSQTQDSPISSPTSSVVADNNPLKKGRTLRMSRKEKLRSKFRDRERLSGMSRSPTMETIADTAPLQPAASIPSSPNIPPPPQADFLKAKPGQLDDPMVVTQLIDEARDVIGITQFFVGTFFHYTSQVDALDFKEYLGTHPLEERRKFADKYSGTNIDLDTVMSLDTAAYDTRDVIANMTAIFGNYINTFIKSVNPIDYRIPQILVHLEHWQSVVASKPNQEYVVYNFYKRVIDKLTSQWRKFFSSHFEFAAVTAAVVNPEVLPGVRAANDLIMATERSVANAKHLADTSVRQLIDSTYNEATESLVHMFLREDPLLKSSEFDDHQRHQRLVPILRNVFFLIDSLRQVQGQSINRMVARFDSVFNQIKSKYFAMFLHQSIGKLIEFIVAHEKHGKPSKYNKKSVQALVHFYNHRQLSERAQVTFQSFDASFNLGIDYFERDLVARLWSDLENEYVNIFTRLASVMRQNYPDIDYTAMSKHEIHQVFREAQARRPH
ncbi:hypothetical protein DIRU0_A03158 [Diutina rugosa]